MASRQRFILLICGVTVFAIILFAGIIYITRDKPSDENPSTSEIDNAEEGQQDKAKTSESDANTEPNVDEDGYIIPVTLDEDLYMDDYGSEDDVYVGDDITPVHFENENHINDNSLMWTTETGYQISVGVKVDETDGIILSPHCSGDDPIGYYINAEDGIIQTSTTNAGNWTEDESQHDFVIVQRFHDAVVPAGYSDAENYGVKWIGTGLLDDCIITMRVINLYTSEFIGICGITISPDDGIYHISDISSADVSQTGELPNADRKDAVKKAIAFAEETLFPTKTGDWQKAAEKFAVVDKTNTPYFINFLDTDKQAQIFYQDKSGMKKYSCCRDLFAVTIPTPAYGYATIYLTPKMELAGLEAPPPGGEYDLQVFGFDPLNPRSNAAVVAPGNFNF